MKTEDENFINKENNKRKNSNIKKTNINFIANLKNNWFTIILVILVIICIGFTINKINTNTSENNISEGSFDVNNIVSIDKVTCYSNAYGVDTGNSTNRLELKFKSIYRSCPLFNCKRRNI